MTHADDVLRLPICPVCKDTKSVYSSPPHYTCKNCDVEWSPRLVVNLKNGENITDSLFPDRQPRKLGYVEL